MYSITETGIRIKTLRKARKYTQAELSEIIGCSESNLQKIERGKSSGSLELLCVISEFFNVSLDYLINGVVWDSNDKVELKRIFNGISAEQVELGYKLLMALLE